MTEKKNLIHKASNVQLVIFDIDGVMSQGHITYSSKGQESKSFYVQDGLGIKLLHQAHIKTAIITGRTSDIVTQRAKELGIHYLIQGRDDKLRATQELMEELSLNASQLAYMGDDLPDLSAIQFVSLGVCPNNACTQVKAVANLETQKSGGEGAVRELCEFILKAQGKLDTLIEPYYL